MHAHFTRRRLLAGLSTLIVTAAGCQSVPGGLPSQPAAQAPVVTETLPVANGEVIGSGPVRVAVLLPLGATSNGGRIGMELRNAAQLAIEDFGVQSLQIVVKDTAGEPAKALAMATEATGRIRVGPRPDRRSDRRRRAC